MKDSKRLLVIEEGVVRGGVGQALGASVQSCLGLPDRFVEHGTPADLEESVGLSVEKILKRIDEETA